MVPQKKVHNMVHGDVFLCVYRLWSSYVGEAWYGGIRPMYIDLNKKIHLLQSSEMEKRKWSTNQKEVIYTITILENVVYLLFSTKLFKLWIT